GPADRRHGRAYPERGKAWRHCLGDRSESRAAPESLCRFKTGGHAQRRIAGLRHQGRRLHRLNATAARPTMSINSSRGALEVGLIFGLVALSVLISFRILRFPDLTVDGSFPLGGAVAATLISAGWDPFTATLSATLAGGLAGAVTGWLNVRLRIMDLLASILMMIALYSINLRVMGRPNVPLITEPTVFSILQPDFLDDYVARPLLLLVVIIAAKLLLDWYFSTQTGLAMRATGSNPRMARSQGVPTGAMVLLGMAISNALCALAGALFAQSQGGADISM